MSLSVAPPIAHGIPPSVSLSDRLTDWAKEHYIVTGIAIIALILIAMHIWARHIRTPPSEKVLQRLRDTAGWYLEGTSPTVEIIPIRITPTILLYDERLGGRTMARYQAVITPLPDGIATCTGLHIRPHDDDLEVAVKESDRFVPLRKIAA